jgi:hypothetical protein
MFHGPPNDGNDETGHVSMANPENDCPALPSWLGSFADGQFSECRHSSTINKRRVASTEPTGPAPGGPLAAIMRPATPFPETIQPAREGVGVKLKRNDLGETLEIQTSVSISVRFAAHSLPAR